MADFIPQSKKDKEMNAMSRYGLDQTGWHYKDMYQRGLEQHQQKGNLAATMPIKGAQGSMSNINKKTTLSTIRGNSAVSHASSRPVTAGMR